jgi:tetratricopeptide (TPR) repeat protein
MKKISAVLIIFVIAGASVYGSEITRTKHYEIISDGINADGTAKQMEVLFEVFNRIFMFDPNLGSLPLRVRIFSNTTGFNNYIQTAFAPATEGALYLHYAQSDLRELLIDLSNSGAKEALPYQAFIQYIRAFAAQPPLWMQKGFAEFFIALSFNKNGDLVYEENLSWLPVVKNMRARPSIEEILMSANETDNFHYLACSLVSFFLNSEKDEYTRSFTDSLMTLSNNNTTVQNTTAVSRRILLGHNAGEMARDFQNYINSRKTFSELISEGQRAFSTGDRTGAELSFRAAIEIKSNHFIPYYYMGLLAYNAGRFDDAKNFYLAAIDNDPDTALVYYALGINSAAAGKIDEAVDYLNNAGREDPARYREKAGTIIELFDNFSY